MIESRRYNRKARAIKLARFEAREVLAEIDDAMAEPYVEYYSDGTPIGNPGYHAVMILSVGK
jgi:hypothetical protein